MLILKTLGTYNLWIIIAHVNLGNLMISTFLFWCFSCIFKEEFWIRLKMGFQEFFSSIVKNFRTCQVPLNHSAPTLRLAWQFKSFKKNIILIKAYHVVQYSWLPHILETYTLINSLLFVRWISISCSQRNQLTIINYNYFVI